MDKTEPKQTPTRREEKARQKEAERHQDHRERLVADQFYHSVANMIDVLIRSLESDEHHHELAKEDLPDKKKEAVSSFLKTLGLLTPKSRYLKSQKYTMQQALLLAYPDPDDYNRAVQQLSAYGYEVREKSSARERAISVFSAIGSSAAKSFAFSRQK